jgi:hypothetical protein
MTLVLQLGGNLLKTYENRSEAEVKQDLLSPFLQKAAHCVSMMIVKDFGEEFGDDPSTVDNKDLCEYHSAFTMETVTEAHKGHKGRKPAVNYTFSGW